jgi:hypothetical protein
LEQRGQLKLPLLRNKHTYHRRAQKLLVLKVGPYGDKESLQIYVVGLQLAGKERRLHIEVLFQNPQPWLRDYLKLK